MRFAARLLPVLVLVATVAGIRGADAPRSPNNPPATDKGRPLDPDHAAKMAKGTDLFKATVRGILQAKCVKCHTGDRIEGEFDMTTRDGLLKGGHGGPGKRGWPGV